MTMREVWMWNEWGHAWPLWSADGPLAPDDLGISVALADELKEWHEAWEGLQAGSVRWADPRAQVHWEDVGEGLLERLRAELDGLAAVVSGFRSPEDDHALARRGRGRS
ncbi:hypothetical protein KNO15_20845 [Leifsonia shinshuensis]|uniref:hypothetical protein n=1 Tax=Leifsonia shinshuensis TaxID=150026 RepID=UPI001F50EF4D|nr:hypothetical protein [Leifsonia shinshuensis]MCI0159158.1 hypothetical protein [Leifsonia shinshuensis]